MQNDWEINPDNYLKDDNGDFVLKVDGTPKKRGGRKKGTKSRHYTYSKATKERLQANRAVREKEKLIKIYKGIEDMPLTYISDRTDY